MLTSSLLRPSPSLKVHFRKLQEAFLLFSTIPGAWTLLWAISIFSQATPSELAFRPPSIGPGTRGMLPAQEAPLLGSTRLVTRQDGDGNPGHGHALDGEGGRAHPAARGSWTLRGLQRRGKVPDTRG